MPEGLAGLCGKIGSYLLKAKNHQFCCRKANCSANPIPPVLIERNNPMDMCWLSFRNCLKCLFAPSDQIPNKRYASHE
jgi:hypothetical protein